MHGTDKIKTEIVNSKKEKRVIIKEKVDTEKCAYSDAYFDS